MHAIRFDLTLILGTILIPLQTAPASRRPEPGCRTLPWKTGGPKRFIPPGTARNRAPLGRRPCRPSGQVERSGGERRLPTVVQRGDRARPVRRGKPAARTLLGVDPRGTRRPRLGRISPGLRPGREGGVRTVAQPTSRHYSRDRVAGHSRPRSRTPRQRFAVGEAYLQRLNRDGRYDVARRLCELACKADAPTALKHHFEARMARLDLLGKPAPVISGTDVDGHQVSLADLKGKVVLVDFWESWCSQCVASFIALDALAQKYHRRGFVIVGVNLDAKHPDVKDAKRRCRQLARSWSDTA